MNEIKVKAKMDAMGNIIVAPTDPAWRNAFARCVSESTGRPVEDETEAFFQDGAPAQEFIRNDVPKRLQGHLLDGWSIEFEIDPWVVGHWYGYDACMAAPLV